jgi:hypothetical protein
MHEASHAYQRRFEHNAETLKVGQTLIVERFSKTGWVFVDQFGWCYTNLPDNTQIEIVGSPEQTPRFMVSEKHTLTGKVYNNGEVSLLRRKSVYWENLNTWYHDDLKFWNADAVTIISLPK